MCKKEDQNAGREESVVSRDSRPCPFLGMKAFASCFGIIGYDFFIPFPFPNFGNSFFVPFLFPSFWNNFFIPCPTLSFGNGIIYSVIELPNVILQYRQYPWKGWGTGVSLFGQCLQAYIIFLWRSSLTDLNGRQLPSSRRAGWAGRALQIVRSNVFLCRRSGRRRRQLSWHQGALAQFPARQLYQFKVY